MTTSTVADTAADVQADGRADNRTSTATLASEEPADATFRTAQRRSDRIEAKLRVDPTGLRVVTGDRPTGPLHLGHYLGHAGQPGAAAGPRSAASPSSSPTTR